MPALSRGHATLCVLMLSACASAPSHVGPGPRPSGFSWTGEWEARFDTWTFFEERGQVIGVAGHSDMLIGHAEANALEGYILGPPLGQHEPGRSLPLALRVAPDGEAFVGTFNEVPFAASRASTRASRDEVVTRAAQAAFYQNNTTLLRDVVRFGLPEGGLAAVLGEPQLCDALLDRRWGMIDEVLLEVRTVPEACRGRPLRELLATAPVSVLRKVSTLGKLPAGYEQRIKEARIIEEGRVAREAPGRPPFAYESLPFEGGFAAIRAALLAAGHRLAATEKRGGFEANQFVTKASVPGGTLDVVSMVIVSPDGSIREMTTSASEVNNAGRALVAEVASVIERRLVSVLGAPAVLGSRVRTWEPKGLRVFFGTEVGEIGASVRLRFVPRGSDLYDAD